MAHSGWLETLLFWSVDCSSSWRGPCLGISALRIQVDEKEAASWFFWGFLRAVLRHTVEGVRGLVDRGVEDALVRAERLGYPHARSWLGYFKGEGNPSAEACDSVRGQLLEWLEVCALTGCNESARLAACLVLVSFYWKGNLVEADPEQADVWWGIAFQRGFRYSIGSMMFLVSKLPKESDITGNDFKLFALWLDRLAADGALAPFHEASSEEGGSPGGGAEDVVCWSSPAGFRHQHSAPRIMQTIHFVSEPHFMHMRHMSLCHPNLEPFRFSLSEPVEIVEIDEAEEVAPAQRRPPPQPRPLQQPARSRQERSWAQPGASPRPREPQHPGRASQERRHRPAPDSPASGRCQPQPQRGASVHPALPREEPHRSDGGAGARWGEQDAPEPSKVERRAAPENGDLCPNGAAGPPGRASPPLSEDGGGLASALRSSADEGGTGGIRMLCAVAGGDDASLGSGIAEPPWGRPPSRPRRRKSTVAKRSRKGSAPSHGQPSPQAAPEPPPFWGAKRGRCERAAAQTWTLPRAFPPVAEREPECILIDDDSDSGGRAQANGRAGGDPSEDQSRLPEGWPRTVGFVQMMLLTPNPSKEELEQARIISAPTAGVEIRRLSWEGMGPASACGIFATKPFARGDTIGWYTGVLVRGPRPQHSKYICRAKGSSYSIDATRYGNEFRFMRRAPKESTKNARPNALKANLRTVMNTVPNFSVSLQCLRDIATGEELISVDEGHD